MTNRREEERGPMLSALALFAAIALAIAMDLISDLGESGRVTHVAVEAGVIVLAVIGFAGFAHRLRRVTQSLRREAESLRRRGAELASDLERSSAEVERWRTEAKQALEGLGAAIERQFGRWALTNAEQEVGLLLLKGLSHREIGDLRGVSERTVRQQARALYRKAGLAGRADLAAFFLEDLLLPAPAAAALSGARSSPDREHDRSDEERRDRRH